MFLGVKVLNSQGGGYFFFAHQLQQVDQSLAFGHTRTFGYFKGAQRKDAAAVGEHQYRGVRRRNEQMFHKVFFFGLAADNAFAAAVLALICGRAECVLA